ncbi:WD40 repeat domain-containing protein [Actinomadura graeca]|uniref:WD40 repeat domain-containing protein n=1 Tax=Actinomadura graeca TaxID=2750812 RepID=A0ABX8QQI1_9ACTN|nr:WD40 repeat domain-containing protein [Actinomadura graeca]QXJ20199.1 WD40 repeat domain-containing protein [Actinomadura graeca]
MSDPRLDAWAAAHARSAGRAGVGSRPGTTGGDGDLLDVGTWLPGPEVVRSLDWKPADDGEPLLACGNGEGVTILGGSQGERRGSWFHAGLLVRWAQAAGTWHLLSTDGLRTTLWHPDSPGSTRTRYASVEGESVRAIAFDGLRELIATGSTDGVVRVWGINEPDPSSISRLVGHSDLVLSVGWSAHGLLASGSADGTVHVWDWQRHQRLHVLAHRAWVSDVAFAEMPDGESLLASAANDGFARIWNPLTGDLLHTLRGHLMEVSCVDWTVLPDGRALLATCSYDRTVRVWDGRTGVCLATSDDLGGVLHAVSWGRSPDGRLLLAAGGATDGIRVFSLTLPDAPRATAAVAPTGVPEVIPPVEEVLINDPVPTPGRALPGGVNAVVERLGIRIVRRETGEEVARLAGHTEPITSYDWTADSEGRLVLAAGGETGQLCVWYVESGRLITAVTCPGRVTAVALAALPQGRLVAVAGTASGELTLWDETGDRPLPLPGHTYVAGNVPGHGGAITSARWAVLSDGHARLATADDQGKVQIWDERGRFSMSMPHHVYPITSLRWAVLPDGTAYLAIFASSEILIVDKGGTVLRAFPLLQSEPLTSVDLTALADGRLLLATVGFATREVRVHDARTGAAHRLGTHVGTAEPPTVSWIRQEHGPLQIVLGDSNQSGVSDVTVTPPPPGSGPPPAAADAPAPSRALVPARLGLLKLGSGALWPALGLVADLLSLTGRHTGELHDPRLAVLEAHPGVARLRQLGWPAAARVAFAALLASRLPDDAGFGPPGAGVRRLEEALGRALATATLPAAEPAAEPEALAAAADEITQQTVALLALIGPRAAAEDPLLPLHLGHLEVALPPLTDRQLRLLAQHGHPPDRRLRRSGGGTPRHTPGTAGIVRHGLLRHMLHTDLALPPDLLALRRLENQLLYRRHTTPQPPTPRPLTLVLDTTPPTYGTVELVLRMAVHALTVASWEHGLEPVLVTLTDPDRALTLTGPRQLLTMWTSRTLQPPYPALDRALDTAAQTGRTTVLLLHHHSAGKDRAPGPATPFVTTRHAVEPARPRPAHPDHHELPPEPGGMELDDLVSALLLPGAAR